MIQYAKDRDKAFTDFVHDDDFGHIEKLFKKYGLPMADYPIETRKAGVYKAVQECAAIDDETKAIAREKCIALGYKPTMM